MKKAGKDADLIPLVHLYGLGVDGSRKVVGFGAVEDGNVKAY